MNNWPPSDIETLRAMAAQGASSAEIARTLKRTRASVCVQAARRGIKLYEMLRYKMRVE